MTTQTNDKVGVLGLGIIGSIWAGHYHGAGLLGGAWNRTRRQQDFPVAESPAEVVRASRFLQVVVADPPAVEGLLDQILPDLTPSHVVIQSSTIDPESSRRFQEKVKSAGAAYLEAPFTGSKPVAVEKKVVFYLGGDGETVKLAEPVLAAVSGTRFHIGTGERAAALKLAMNLQIALIAEAMCESLAFAKAAGIPADMFFEVMRKNAAWSGVAALKEPKLLSGDYSPQFSVKHMHKDIRLALRSAGGDKLPAGIAVEACFAKAAAAGWGDEDFIALMKNLEEPGA